MSSKQSYKIGDMIIDQKQIFCIMQHSYALIPIIQLLDGHNYLLYIFIDVLLLPMVLYKIITSCINIRSFPTINFISKSL